MTRVVVAEGLKNELETRDTRAVKRLQEAGYQVQLVYYLPKVPAEYTAIPSVNETIYKWREEGNKKLATLGDQLDISSDNRHFIDEVLGPDEVFDTAKQFQADIILTKDKDQLKPSLLTRWMNSVIYLFKGKEEKQLSVETIRQYVNKELGVIKETQGRAVQPERTVNEQKVQALWSKQRKAQPNPLFRKQDTEKKEQEEVTEEDKKRYNR